MRALFCGFGTYGGANVEHLSLMQSGRTYANRQAGLDQHRVHDLLFVQSTHRVNVPSRVRESGICVGSWLCSASYCQSTLRHGSIAPDLLAKEGVRINERQPWHRQHLQHREYQMSHAATAAWVKRWVSLDILYSGVRQQMLRKGMMRRTRH